MKINRIRRTKGKTTELNSRRNKTKLTTRKVCDEKKMRAACEKKLTCKDTAVNLVDDARTNDVQNISSIDESVCPFKERTATKASLKRKKKHSNNEGTVNETSDIQYFMNDSIEWDGLEQQMNEETDDNWKLDNSEEETQGDTDDDWIQIDSKENRNLGSPFIVDMLADGVTSINLPQIFEQEQSTKLDDTMCDDAFKLNALFNKDACKTVAESINSKYNTHIQVKHLKQMSPVPSSITKNDKPKDASDNKLEDITVNNVSNPIGSIHKELVEDESPRSADRSSDTEACGSSKHKNINSRRRECNRKSPKVYCIKNIVIVIMESGSKLCFTGKLLVKVLYGAVKIYGSILNKSADATEVYSPRGYSNITIETSEDFSENSIDDVWMALNAKGIVPGSGNIMQVDINNVRPGMAILMLQNLKNNLTLFLKTHFPYFRLFPNVKNRNYFPWTDPRRAEVILQANLRLEQYDDFNYKQLITDPCITTDIAERMLYRWCADKWSCILITGGKNVGKSTSVRCLINSFIAHVGEGSFDGRGSWTGGVHAARLHLV